MAGPASGLAGRGGEGPGAEAEDLQAQLVIFLRLADPLHADAAHRRHGPRVGGPDDRDDLFYSLVECPPSQRQPGLGGVAMPPLLRVKLPADLEFLVGLQRQQGGPAHQAPVLEKLDYPPASARYTSRVLR